MGFSGMREEAVAATLPYGAALICNDMDYSGMLEEAVVATLPYGRGCESLCRAPQQPL